VCLVVFVLYMCNVGVCPDLHYGMRRRDEIAHGIESSIRFSFQTNKLGACHACATVLGDCMSEGLEGLG
jgi:hypothetical protein